MPGGISWLDVKLGARMLVKYPGLSVVGGLGMAVGIAISAGFFSFFQLLLFPTLPLHEGDRIVALENWDTQKNNGERRSLHDFVAWQQELKSVRELGAQRTVGRNLVEPDGQARPVPVNEITATGFQTARVAPLMGRGLVADDERPGAPPVVVIGYDVWRARFAGDPAVVGRTLRLGSVDHTIVGVMPQGFAWPMNHRFWTPLQLDATRYERGHGPEMFIFGRLAPGATRQQAQAELTAIGQRAAAAHPQTHAHLRPQVLPYTYPLTDVVGMWEAAMMQGMVTLLLVAVALNVAILVYARTATRRGEIAVRTALGASRGRIVGQLFVEGLVLSGAAALAGLALARLGLGLGRRIMDQEMGNTPFWMHHGLSPATVLYTVGLALFAAVVVGVLPALQATGRRVEGSLRQLGGATGMRMGKTWTALIVAQVVVALVVLPAALAVAWGEVRSAATTPRFAAAQFMAAEVALEPEPPSGSVDAETYERAQGARYGDRLVELMRRVEAEPGVSAVTFAAASPGQEPWARVEVDGAPMPAHSSAGHEVVFTRVAPGFFDVLGVSMLAGRPLGPGDAGAQAVPVVVNRRFGEQVLGGASPLGRRVRYAHVAHRAPAGSVEPERWYEIVGVVDDLHANPMDPARVQPTLYHAAAPGQVVPVLLTARLRGGDPDAFRVRLRQLAMELDPALRLQGVRSLAAGDGQQAAMLRLVAVSVGLVVLSVLLLSAAGIYALMSFTVSQRRREIGIRAALGADPRHILGSVFSRAGRQLGIGLAAGVAAATLLDWSVDGELMGGQSMVLVPLVAVLMGAAGLLAAFGPARRGLRIQPMEALREE